MQLRTGALALAIATLAGASAQAQSFQYAPGTAKYKITSTGKMAMEMMGQHQEMEMGSEQLVTVVLAPQAKDTLSMSMTIDSVAIQQQIPGAPDLSSLKGSKVVAMLSPIGQVYSVKVPDGIQGGEQLDEMVRFLPKLRSGLAAGMTWVDTLSRKRNNNGIDVESNSIVTSKVVGQESVAGEQLWKIARTGETKLSGSGSTQGQPITMEGTVASNDTIYVSPKGTLVSTQGSGDTKLKITLVANGMEIAQTVTSTTKIERMK
jgi:hypothetical protein